MKIDLANNLEIDTEVDRLPVHKIYEHLNTTYWASNRTFLVVEKSIKNSLCFGMYEKNVLIGFARVVTDYCIFAYLCDVYILPAHQGKGLGKCLIKCIHEFEELKSIRRWLLATKDAHGLYQKEGYTQLENPARWMEFRKEL